MACLGRTCARQVFHLCTLQCSVRQRINPNLEVLVASRRQPPGLNIICLCVGGRGWKAKRCEQTPVKEVSNRSGGTGRACLCRVRARVSWQRACHQHAHGQQRSKKDGHDHAAATGLTNRSIMRHSDRTLGRTACARPRAVHAMLLAALVSHACNVAAVLQLKRPFYRFNVSILVCARMHALKAATHACVRGAVCCLRHSTRVPCSGARGAACACVCNCKHLATIGSPPDLAFVAWDNNCLGERAHRLRWPS